MNYVYGGFGMDGKYFHRPGLHPTPPLSKLTSPATSVNVESLNTP